MAWNLGSLPCSFDCRAICPSQSPSFQVGGEGGQGHSPWRGHKPLSATGETLTVTWCKSRSLGTFLSEALLLYNFVFFS